MISKCEHPNESVTLWCVATVFDALSNEINKGDTPVHNFDSHWAEGLNYRVSKPAGLFVVLPF